MSAGIEVPHRIFSHGFLFNRGEKMSKSIGNVVDPFDLAETYGVDQLRYFFLREVPFGKDGNYSHEAIVNRSNADLANGLGNLAQRSLSMISKQFGGSVPKPGPLTKSDQSMLHAADKMIDFARQKMQTQQLHQILNHIWTVVAHANQYFTEQEPWMLAKTDPLRQGTVLYVTAEVLRQIAILIHPFVPASASKLLDLLGIPEAERTFAFVGGKRRIAVDTMIPAPTPVFPRYVENEWEEFFKSGRQFYVTARFAAFAALVPVTGNLFHEAIEMFLKGGLSKTGHTLVDLKKLGHDLQNLWSLFKAAFSDSALDKFDETIVALQAFEDIRYPHKIVATGMSTAINITRPASPTVHSIGPEPKYDLCVQDVDELVGQLFRTVGANPSAFLRFSKPDAKKYLEEDNVVKSLVG
jgi:hypothetical protein